LLRPLKFSLFSLVLSAFVVSSVIGKPVVQEEAFHSKHLPVDGMESTFPILLIFVSFSLGEKALLNLAQEAKHTNASLVLRGFKDGSYLKTAKALEKIITKTGIGFTVDPELFALFNISVVPTYVLSKPFPPHATERNQTPLHDRLMGHVSVKYVLETFAKEGSLKNEVKALLQELVTP